MPVGKGGTTNLPTDSSLLRHQPQNDFLRSFRCVTLALAWVPGRSDLKQVSTLMPQPLQFSWQNSRILIADDEPDMREIFAAWFRQLGCIVTEAADGQDALEAVSCDPFDALVTHLPMPPLHGLQLSPPPPPPAHYT